MAQHDQEYERFHISGTRRGPLVQFMLEALEQQGCRIILTSPPNVAPFRITFATPSGERLGIVAYAFKANTRLTKNRPSDEHRFQVKYGSKEAGRVYDLWQDPFGMYTTLFLGIDPEREIFVGADPVLHSPTRFFISVEFKAEHVEQIRSRGWHAWERERRPQDEAIGEPAEVLVGGTKASFLRYVRFEREALGEDQGHRQLLAERDDAPSIESNVLVSSSSQEVDAGRLHALAREFELEPDAVLDLIAEAPRLKMAVRGWVAEAHLVRRLSGVPCVTECRHINAEGRPDVELRFEDSPPITIECKNVLRRPMANGHARMDFMRTRASMADPCSRYYSTRDFDVVAACLHAVTERWEYRYILPVRLDPHDRCEGKLNHRVRIDDRWQEDIADVLRAAARRKTDDTVRA